MNKPARGRVDAPISRRVLLAAVIGTAVAGCARTNAQPSVKSTSGPATVGQYASANPGSVNVFWLHTPKGLVVVDTGRALSDARQALARIRQTGKSVSAILLTHSHPDHVGGAGVISDAYPAAPIYASHATAELMRTDPLGFYPLTRQGLGADYPAKVIPPTRTFDPGATIKVDGVTFQTAEFGPGESESATAYYEPVSRSLFCGDLLCNKATPALLEGHSCGWLTNLDQLERHFSQAKTCYPGHGTPADTRTLLTAQRAYLQQVRGLVHNATAPASPGGVNVTTPEQQSILAAMDHSYPRYPSVASIPNMPQRNVAAVATELTHPTGQAHCCCGS
ncbi:quinoprotein relay system zinc metallohydrolase 2 [Fodinicola feengrottensis]|uniref:Quinoprotein relay system zinc metallohydrolase 2 n=1 Tax=Fodinicola feengrottensis TaxID=435914 RepID=A0ABN2FR79_9ACTN